MFYNDVQYSEKVPASAFILSKVPIGTLTL